MRIGITIPTLTVAGGVKCLLELGWYLRERGHKVDYFWKSFSLKNHVKSSLFPPVVDWTPHKHQITAIRDWAKLPHRDVMIASSWRTAGPVLQWQHRRGGRGIYWVQHHESVWDGGDEAAATYRLPLDKVVISSWLREVMEQQYGQQSALCVTPVDEELFTASDDRDDRARRVLMLHHTFDWKGIRDGLDAISVARNDIPNLQLVMVGGREERPSLPEGTEYHYQPDRENLGRLYASCGTFLCSSWHEGLGMPAMEAMATGALLVTTDTRGSRDFAKHGETALVSPPRDPTALGANLALALKQWDSFEGMRMAGKSMIRGYSWDDNCQTLENLLTS